MKDFFDRFNIFKQMKDESKRKSFLQLLKDMFTKNLSAKLMCLFASLFLWFYVMDFENSSYERTFKDIKIDYTENANGMGMLSSNAETVDVTLSGKRSIIKNMKASDIVAVADISNITESGNKKVEIMVSTSNETSVEDFEPRTVKINIDRTDTVPVEVKAVFRGESNYDVVTSVDPKMIYVSGPMKELENIAYAKVVVNSPGKTYDAEIVLCKKNGSPAETKFVEMSAQTANVQVSLYKEAKFDVSVDVSGYELFYDDDAIVVNADPVKVTVYGEKDIIEAMSSVETEKVIIDDITRIGSELYSVKYDLPEGVELVDAENNCEVSVEVKNFSSNVLEIPIERIKILNLPDECSVDFLNDTVSLAVSGVSQNVKNASAKDFELVIDAADLVVGKNDNCRVMVSFDDMSNVYACIAEDTPVAVVLNKNY